MGEGHSRRGYQSAMIMIVRSFALVRRRDVEPWKPAVDDGGGKAKTDGVARAFRCKKSLRNERIEHGACLAGFVARELGGTATREFACDDGFLE
jgi:hypothetical protein